MEDEIKNSIYAGMSIYKKLEILRIRLKKDFLTQEEKKYLSLYLGILNTNNKMSNMLNPRKRILNIDVKFDKLDMDEYIQIYNNSFFNILLGVNFESLDEYTNYLLSKEIIKIFNEINNIQVEQLVETSNKQLVKK